MRTTLVLARPGAGEDRIDDTKDRMLALKAGSGTSVERPARQASFAPRKMVRRRVGGAVGAESWARRRAKGRLVVSEVYLEGMLGSGGLVKGGRGLEEF